MEDLQKQIDELTERALTFLNEGNKNKCRVLMDQADKLKKQLAEINGPLQHEQTVAPKEFDHVKMFGLDFDAYAETGSDILNTWAESMLNHQHLEIHKRYNDTIEQLTGKVNSISLENEALVSTNKVQDGRIQQLTEERNRYKLEYDDYKSRFEAATTMLGEIELEQATDRAEIDRLKRRETELQETIARAPATSVSFIDIESSSASEFDPEALIRKAQEIKQAKEAEKRRNEEEKLANRPKITNKRWEKEFGVGAKTISLAELVGNYPGIGNDGETIKIGTFDINKYVEVTADEAGRFRTKAAPTIENPAEDIPLVESVTVPVVEKVQQFPEETGPIMDEGSQVADEQQGVQLSTKERLAKLEKLVQGLEEDVAILYGKTGQVA